MRIFWKHGLVTKRLKILRFNANIQTKLVYGLHTIALTDAMVSKLNAFQLRGYRQIMKIKTTFVDRANTNVEVYKQVEEELNRVAKRSRPKKQRIIQVGAKIIALSIQTLGELIRLDNDNPLRKVTFYPSSAKPMLPTYQRAGRPRVQWTQRTMQRAWQQHELWQYLPGTPANVIDFDMEAGDH